MKRKAATYVAKIYQGAQVVTSEHRALDKKEVRRMASRDYPRADRIQVCIPMPSGDLVVVEDWRAA